MYVFISSWIICWEYCCCFWICSASDCMALSHSAWAPSVPRSILALAFLSIMWHLLVKRSLQKSLVYPHKGLPNLGLSQEDHYHKKITHRFARSFIHPSA